MRKIRKKIKGKGSWKIQNGKVSYVCSQCNTKEDIPTDVVNLFDLLDPGDPSVPPRFSCEKCGGVMLPI
jgi:transcription initiation factor IIE alpha subunit